MNKYLLLLLALLAFSNSQAKDPVVFGYYPGSWGSHPESGGVPPQHILSKLTHAVYFSMALQGYYDGTSKEDGRLGHLDTTNFDTKKMLAFRDSAHAVGTKTILLIGGWGISTSEMAFMANTVESRTTFINEVVTYLDKHNLDGVDIDWEFPNGINGYHNFRRLITELKLALPNKTVACAINPQGIESFPTEFLTAPDHISIMAYDLTGDHHAPQHAVYYLDQLAYRGAPKENIIFGLPFYGRSNVPGSAKTYRQLTEEFDIKFDVDSVQGVDADSLMWRFNSANTVYNKTKYAIENGYAGVLMWELDLDANYASDLSLLKAIAVAAGTDSLDSTPYYSYTLPENPYSSFAPTSSYTEPSSSSQINAINSKNENNIKINFNSIDFKMKSNYGQFSIFDQAGRIVAQFQLNEARQYSFVLPRTPGNYIIQVIDDQLKSTSNLVID